MKNAKNNQNAASVIETLIEEIEANTEESIEIQQRYKDIIRRQQALTQQNGGGTTQPSDIISLNVSGTEMFARRDTLTIVSGSSLEALFSGRWENQLLRDAKGRVFMDVEPLVFRKILEYLYMLKVAGGAEASLELPSVSPEMKPSFDQYITFFALQPATVPADAVVEQVSTIEEKDSSDDASTASRAHVAELMVKSDTLLTAMEKKLEAEEAFVAHFTKSTDVKQQQKQQHTNCKRASSVSDETDHLTVDTTPSTDTVVSDADLGIMNLYINGEVLAVKRSTLCFDPESKLAQDFADDAWLEEHWVVTETGKALVLIELPAVTFKQTVYQLQRMSIAVDNKECVSQIVATPLAPIANTDSTEYAKRISSHNISAKHETIKSLPVSANAIDDSVIIGHVNDKLKIREWLESVNKTSTPKLLYRATRDGRKAADFHRECDNKGATLTVIKNSEGYIFGGYSGASWTSNGGYTPCSDAFLFSLRCRRGLPAVKMNLKGSSSYAIYCDSGYGPTFGNQCYDLSISSNTGCSSKIGSTYSLPPGTTKPYFLTGRGYFQFSEYEVFQV